MMFDYRRYLSTVLIMVCLFSFPFNVALSAEEENKLDEYSQEEISAVITLLEDPEKRDELITTLKILGEASGKEEKSNELKTVAAQLIYDIGTYVDHTTEYFTDIADSIYDVPALLTWLRDEFDNEASRERLMTVLVNLALVIGVGYLSYYVLRLLLYKVRMSLCEKELTSPISKLVTVAAYLVVELLPIICFALFSYLSLGIVKPKVEIRLVALAWINGFLISHVMIVVFSMIFSEHSAQQRFLRISDETASYLMIWAKRITYTTVYGYFFLQALMLLGLPILTYDALLRVLGICVSSLTIIVIFQNREEVAGWMARKAKDDAVMSEIHPTEGDVPKTSQKGAAKGVLYKLSKVWHLLTSAYVVLLYLVWALQISGGFLYLFKATVFTFLTVLASRFCLKILHTLFSKGFQVGEEVKMRLPGLEKRVNQYTYTLYRVLRWVCYTLTIIIVLQLWGVNTFSWLTGGPGRIVGGRVLSIAGIIIVALIIWEVTTTFIENYLLPKSTDSLETVRPRTITLLTVARKALAIILTIVAALMILAELGINIAPLLAGAGVLGLAIGFGSQKLVQDVITGIFILLEDQMAVGDVVDIGGLAGVVEAVSIRTVTLRDVTGTVHTVPFSSISILSNKTKEFSFYVMDIGIAYREDVDHVMEVLREIGAELQSDPEYGPKIIEPLDILGLDRFDDSAVIIKARLKTIPTKQWWVGREFNKRMKRKFDELDIEIPFPHQTIYFGVNKQGEAPPAKVNIERPQATSG